MSYKIVSHTADLRMAVSGKNIEELFSSALAGMMDFLGPRYFTKEEPIRRIIKIESPDQSALLVDFLNEVLSLAQINREVYEKIILKKSSDTKLEAELSGKKIENFIEDIKAVTYHEVDIKHNEKGDWQTTLIFDI